MKPMEAGLRKMHERTQCLLKAVSELQALENIAEADIEQLALLKTELLELCPPERYAWIDGLPKIDIVAELTKLDDERRRIQMDAIENRKTHMFKAMMEAIEPAVQEARADRDRAFGKIETLRSMAANIKEREAELKTRLEAVKGEIAGSVERGKSLDVLVKKSTEIRAEMDALADLAEDLEDSRLPGAKADLERAEEDLNRKVQSVVDTSRAAFQEELDQIINDNVEATLLAWPRAVWEIVTGLKLKGALSPVGMRIDSSTVRQHTLPY